MILRILLVESETDDSLFLRDVLTDLDGARCWSDWVHVELSHAATWTDTEAILATHAVDILLLDPDLPDCRGAETFRRVQTAAPHVPVVLLVDSSATSLAERMVRDGAQDFLLKQEVDCAPLARAIRSALERHRLLAAARATSMTDQLTGLLSKAAFLTFAARDRLLAERLTRRMMVLLAEHRETSHCEPFLVTAQARDLALVEAADILRALAGPGALVARLEHSLFGVSVIDTDADSIEEIRARVAGEGKIVSGAAVFDPQQPLPVDTLFERAALDLQPKTRPAVV